MPTCRGIEVKLASQFGVYPEYDKTNTSVDTKDIYISMHPASQFWFRYYCTLMDDSPFLYFKLFVNDTPVVSWGCGAEEEWRGVTAFVPTIIKGVSLDRSRIEKRGFFFPKAADPDHRATESVLEIRVFRAKARKREQRQYASEATLRDESLGLRMDSAGSVRRSDPKRYFTYALIDPTDEPYATIRYHCRGLDELRRLGVVGIPNDATTQQNTEPDHMVDPEVNDLAGQGVERASYSREDDALDIFVTTAMDSPKTRTLVSSAPLPDEGTTGRGWMTRSPSPVRADRRRLRRRTTPPVPRTDEARMAVLKRVVAQALGRKNASVESHRLE